MGDSPNIPEGCAPIGLKYLSEIKVQTLFLIFEKSLSISSTVAFVLP